ncbi:MAG: dihydropyrimidinase [Acidimicrobiales bacterium]|jgi:dihydropyrimidinase
MAQDSREEDDEQLRLIMAAIHASVREAAEQYGQAGNYVLGANIAGCGTSPTRCLTNRSSDGPGGLGQAGFSVKEALVLIQGGVVIDAAGERPADVRTAQDGRVAEVSPGLDPLPGERVHDASGKLVIPGGIDVHTHLHMPVGAVRVSDDFVSGTRAAAIGGTTTIIDYVTVMRGDDPMATVATWRSWAEPSAIDWGLHLTFTEAVSESVVAAGVEAGITSFKLYLAYPDRLQVDDATIVRLMRAARRQGALVTLHCENGGAIEELRREALAAGRTDVIEHARTRPAVLEAEAVARAAALAEVTSASIYIVHVSSAPALAAVRAAQERGVDIKAETCPQYLYLDVSRLEGPDAVDFVCTPPLRDPWHAEELWQGLASGYVHTVATDHCPFWRADRRAGVAGRPGGVADFTDIPGGLPGIETRLALVYQGVRAGRISAADWVRLCAEAPARTFGLWPAKGSLAAGADADVVVWDPNRHQSLAADKLDMAVDQSPYETIVSIGWPELVLSRGEPVAADGSFTGELGWGRYLARAPLET